MHCSYNRFVARTGEHAYDAVARSHSLTTMHRSVRIVGTVILATVLIWTIRALLEYSNNTDSMTMASTNGSFRGVSMAAFTTTSAPQTLTHMAIVTLVSTDDSVLSARVLAASIDAVGGSEASTLDRVAIVTGAVSLAGVHALEQARWRVYQVPFIPNPFMQSNEAHALAHTRITRRRQWESACKLYVFDMAMYQQVLFIDVDSMVTGNLDHFLTTLEQQRQAEVNDTRGTVLAAAMHRKPRLDTNRWLFDTSVMVVRPSRALFRDITEHMMEFGGRSVNADEEVVHHGRSLASWRALGLGSLTHSHGK